MAEFYYPRSVQETLALLYRTRRDHCVIAGGTDAVVQMSEGRRKAGTLISISQLTALHGIRATADVLEIGAATTFAELTRSPLAAQELPALYEAAAHVGSPQIRARGTFGGNVANASVAGDTIGALLTLGAWVEVQSVRGVRRMPLRSFFRANGSTALAPDELITVFRIPRPGPSSASFFWKLGKRNALAIAEIGGSAAVCWDDRQRITHAALRGGALARLPLEFTAAQEFLCGQPMAQETFEQVMPLLHDAVYESIKHRPLEVGYKKESVKGVFHTVFGELMRQFERKEAMRNVADYNYMHGERGESDRADCREPAVG
ncbi:MAG: FAD binding domain-containing protein [Butyricicoccus sp.]